MQAIIISALEMWPASVSTITTSNSPPPTTTAITPYRPFEELGFPSPEPPAPPPAELSPPLPGSQWTLSPPAEEQQRSSIETVRWYSFGWEVALDFLGYKLLRLGGKGNYIWLLVYWGGKFNWSCRSGWTSPDTSKTENPLKGRRVSFLEVTGLAQPLLQSIS